MSGDTVPMPYGKRYPSLVGSYNYNNDEGYFDITYCPNCGSSNVCCLDPVINPEIESRGLWFCISCNDSWRYELDH